VDTKSVWMLSGMSVILLTAPATATPPTAMEPLASADPTGAVAIDPAIANSPEPASPDFSSIEKLRDVDAEIASEADVILQKTASAEATIAAPDIAPAQLTDVEPMPVPASEDSTAPEVPPDIAAFSRDRPPETAATMPAETAADGAGVPEVTAPVATSAAAAPVTAMQPQLYGEDPLESEEPETAIQSDPLEDMAPEAWQTLVNDWHESDAVPIADTAASGAVVSSARAEPSSSKAMADADPASASAGVTAEVVLPTVPVPSDAMAQITSVSQLSDVQPTDWAFQALQSLVERYGVIAGYPDGLFRGNRTLTRDEFAAGLNAALDAITQQIAVATETQPTADDLATLQRLSDEFATELAVLEGRVDRLEARTAELEAQQFSTTAVLGGQVILGLAAAGGGDPPGTGEGNAVLTHLTLLQVSASFTGQDVLRVGLDAGNFNDRGFASPNSLNTNMALLGYQTDTDDEFDLTSLEYRFAVGDRFVMTVKPVGFSLSTVLTPNSIFASTSNGAISRFASLSPVYRIGSLDAGVGFDWLMTNRLRLQVGYGARDADQGDEGLFSSNHRALGVQLLARPSDNFTTGIAYVNAFAEDGRLDTFTGSNNADVSGGFNEPAAIHALTGTLQWAVTANLIMGTWGGAIVTDSLRSNAVAFSTTYLFSIGLLDPFGREGDLFGVMVGQPPRLEEGFLIEREDEGTSMHYEAFYRFRVNDYLSITPGFFIVTDPGHISENDTIFVTALRTTFSF